MEITCEHCNTKLNVPDGKIPRDQVVKIGCPKCKNKITLNARLAHEEKSSVPEEQSKPHVSSDGRAYDYSDFSGDDSLGFYEEGTKLALVMDNQADRAGTLRSAIEGLGYKFILSPNSRDAMGKLRFYNFDLVLLAEGFDGQALENSPILTYLNHLYISVRRRIFLALISDTFKSADNMMAFALSANLVINNKDMDKLYLILKKAVAENEKFYKVFMDTLVATGKA